MKRLLLTVLVLIIMTAPTSAAPEDTPKGWLFIPSLSLYKPIYFAAIVNRAHDLSQLGYGIAHLEQTNWITDGWGRVVLAGHTPGGFERLDELAFGARVIVGAGDVIKEYVVTELHTVDPSEWEWLAPTKQEDLMLITCSGDSRLIVIAVRTP